MLRLAPVFFLLLLLPSSVPAVEREQQLALNPDVTQLTIGRTICTRGWTATVRPPMQYTSKLKRRQMRERRLHGGMRLFEEDHFIPLELGGSPTDPRNLNPQPWQGACSAHAKDIDENRLHALVCSGRMTLVQAQKTMQRKWEHCFADQK